MNATTARKLDMLERVLRFLLEHSLASTPRWRKNVAAIGALPSPGVARCLPRVSPHHYPHLVRRWRDVARAANMRMSPLVEADGHQLVYLKTPALRAAGGLYISAGVHGDEPGGCEGLLAWAAAQGKELRDLPLLIFPCLNPWGLMQNIRGDCGGHDLNRSFHRRFPMVTAVKRVVGPRQFAAAIHLHEDYDGEGIYLYELTRGRGCAEEIRDAARPFIPIDPRARIDRWLAKNGIIRPRPRRARFERLGYPEAVWLFYEHTDFAYTIETPSEFALGQRVAAQVAAIDAIVHRVFS